MNMNKKLCIISSGYVLLFLTACDPITLAIGGTAAAGVEVARNQNGVTGAISDSALQAQINKFLFDNDRDIFDRVELSVKHGTVVVIGYMKDKDQCNRAMELVRRAGGYHALFDETSMEIFLM